MSDENSEIQVGQKRAGALQLGARKKPYSQFDPAIFFFFIDICSRCSTDPLVHHRRHFGRTIHALCTVSALINNGLLRMGELTERPDEVFTHKLVLFLSFYSVILIIVTSLEKGGSIGCSSFSCKQFRGLKNV